MSCRTILYVGTIWEGSTCLARMRALEQIGFKVAPFDTTPYGARGGRLVRALQHRLNRGPTVTALNRDLINVHSTMASSVDYVWVDKGRWIDPDTLRYFKDAGSASLIHYTPDPQIDYHQSHLFNRCIPEYDVMITTKPFEVVRYRQRGGNIFLMNQSYDASVLGPRNLSANERARFGSDVTFIGRFEAHYEQTLQFLRASGVSVKLWGPGWEKRVPKSSWLSDFFQGSGLWGADYGKGLCATQIGLCLLSKLISETSTTRTFEIPGSGAFMLAQRTAKHQELFEEGKEAEFFSSEEELLSKISFYLKNSEKRAAIAKAGYQRCVNSGYSNHHVMSKIMDIASAPPQSKEKVA